MRHKACHAIGADENWIMTGGVREAGKVTITDWDRYRQRIYYALLSYSASRRFLVYFADNVPHAVYEIDNVCAGEIAIKALRMSSDYIKDLPSDVKQLMEDAMEALSGETQSVAVLDGLVERINPLLTKYWDLHQKTGDRRYGTYYNAIHGVWAAIDQYKGQDALQGVISNTIMTRFPQLVKSFESEVLSDVISPYLLPPEYEVVLE